MPWFRPDRRERAWVSAPSLWALIPLLSFGLLAPVPFAHAAHRLQQRRLWAVTAAYAVGSLLWIVSVSTPEGSWGDTMFAIVFPVLMVAGTVHALLLRRRVFAPPPTHARSGRSVP